MRINKKLKSLQKVSRKKPVNNRIYRMEI